MQAPMKAAGSATIRSDLGGWRGGGWRGGGWRLGGQLMAAMALLVGLLFALTSGADAAPTPTFETPTPGGIISGDVVRVELDHAGLNVQSGWLFAGSQVGASDYMRRHTASADVSWLTDMPAGQGAIHVTYHYKVDGQWANIKTTYQRGGVPTFTAPAPGSVVGSTATVTVDQQNLPMASGWLFIGTSPRSSDVVRKHMGSGNTASVAGLPNDGSTIHGTYLYLVAGRWSLVETTWQAGSLSSRLAAVTNLRVTDQTSTSITMEWDADNDARRQSFDFFVNNSWVTWTTDEDARSHTFTGLAPGTSYQLGVTAVGDPNGNWANQHYSPRITIPGATDAAGEQVVWEDNFNTLDLGEWKVEHSTYGDGNNEMQCYRPRNVWVADGKLVLRAVDETYTCPNGSTRVVTSGMVRSTQARFSPGQAIEFRVKLTPDDSNNQGGLWPAVWASGWTGEGWPLGGELDWLEVMTAVNPKRSIYSAHFKNTNNQNDKKGKEHFGAQNFSANWHTIRFDYGTNGVLEWRLDGEVVNTITDLPTLQGYPAPFNSTIDEIKINLALGGNPGPLDLRALGDDGATFEVDWIRILQVE